MALSLKEQIQWNMIMDSFNAKVVEMQVESGGLTRENVTDTAATGAINDNTGVTDAAVLTEYAVKKILETFITPGFTIN